VDILMLIALAYGLFYAVDRGSHRAGRAVKQRYHAKVAKLASNRGKPTGVTGSLGTRLGAGTATALTGAGLAGSSFWAGAKQGWPEGKQKARDRWGHLKDRAVKPEPGEKTDEYGDPLPELQMPNGKRHTVTEDAPAFERLKTIRDSGYNGWVDQDGHKADTNGKGTMTATTTTRNSEISDYDSLVEWLKVRIKNSAADLEDAQARMQRDTDDARDSEQAVASLSAVDMDPETIGEVQSISEADLAQLEADKQCLANAERVHAQAEASLRNVQKRHSALKEAFDATRHPAQREFYTQG
jgi:hypothetical protein